MKINLALWDRIIRFVLGFMLTTWSIAGGPSWGYFGIYLLMTSGWGICPIYSMLKFRTQAVDERPMVPDMDDED